MIPLLRAAARLVVAGSFLLLWSLAHALVRPAFRGRRRERWRRSYLGGACRGLLRVMGVRVRRHGSRPVGAGFVVSNHLGYLDILVLASVLDCVFVSRADVESWPVLGRLTRWSGTIYLERERRGQLPAVVATMQEWLDRDTLVVFFPEGTSGRGDVVMPFRSSLFEAAVRTGAPVRCAALRYLTAVGDPPADLSVSWWGDMDFGPHLWGLLGLRGVTAHVDFAPGVIQGLDRKDTARRAQADVEARFRPTASVEAATA